MAKKAVQSSNLIEIPGINLKEMRLTIRGKTPLITNRFSEVSQDKMEHKQTGEAVGPQPPRDPKAEFRAGLHVIDEANKVYGFPAAGIKGALVAAGGRMLGEKMTVLRGVLNVMGDLLPIEGSEPEMRRDWGRRSGVAALLYRPMFRQWQIKVPVIFNADLLSKGKVLNLFQHAGFSVGIGEWRPASKSGSGTFGQFEVPENEVVVFE